MHEIGMLHQTAEIAVKYARENGFSEVESIQIAIGELSGAIPYVFEEYFDYVARPYPELKNSILNLRVIPGEALCSRCNALYNVMRNEGVCPRCGSDEKKILGGTRVELVSIVGRELTEDIQNGNKDGSGFSDDN